MVLNNEGETLADVSAPALYLLEAKLAPIRLRLTSQHVWVVVFVCVVVIVKEFFNREGVFAIWVKQKQQIFRLPIRLPCLHHF